jgi:23S rRNA (guanosine2251-2'-O)-methyltransferase
MSRGGQRGSGQLIGGLHAVRTALRYGSAGVEHLWVDARRLRDARLRPVLDLAREAKVALSMADRDELDALVPGVNHQGAVARVRVPAGRDEVSLFELVASLRETPFLLVLDGVQDPHNLGACLRSADAAGVHAVIAPKDRSAGLTPTACKVASGAAESLLFVQVTNLVRTLQRLKDELGLRVVGTAGDAETPLFAADLTGGLVLVMGGEEKGMRRLTREACDLLVSLPMRGTVESLNVSVAAGVCLFEALRQRTGQRALASDWPPRQLP